MSYIWHYGGLPPTGGGSSPIKFVGSVSVGWNSTSDPVLDLTALTGGSDTAAREDDLVLVFAGSPGGAKSVVTTGYAEWASEFFDGDTNSNLTVSAKFMGATPDTSVTVQAASSSFAEAIVVYVLRGVNQTTPQDVTYTVASANGDIIPDPAAITPTTDGALILAVGNGNHSSVIGFTDPTDLDNFVQVASPNSSFDARVGAGMAAWSSGEFDPEKWGLPTAAGSWLAITLALRPA